MGPAWNLFRVASRKIPSAPLSALPPSFLSGASLPPRIKDVGKCSAWDVAKSRALELPSSLAEAYECITDDDGPFDLTKKVREDRKNDVMTGELRKKNKKGTCQQNLSRESP